jgi:Flp pilus assembly protein TadD
LLQQWVEQGVSAGDGPNPTPPPRWRDGWQLGTPDLILKLPRPYSVAAEGRDIYRNFVIPIPLSSRRYVKAVELLPGNAKVLHHAFMFIDATRQSRRLDELDPEAGFAGLHTPPSAQTPPGQFLSWQPGKLPTANPDELAWPLDKGSDLVLQMHLRPSGKPELIQPSIGFYFAAGTPLTRTPFKLGLWTYALDIPGGDPNYQVQDSYVLPVDVEVLKVLPHAHYLARQMQSWATLPDGTRRCLFRIQNWDFNWQGDYAYSKPVFLPRGTTLSMQYTYDNTTNNARNPNQPPRRVKYGLNSTDEMAELWLQLLPRNTNDLAILEKDNQPKVYQSVVSYNTYLLGLDPKNARAHTELGRALLFLNRPAEALPQLQQGSRLQPEDDEPHYFLGLLFRLQGQLADARTEFREALRLNPAHFKAHGNLGLILLQEGNLAEARIHFESALRINPQDTLARESLEWINKAKAGAR